VVGLFSEAAVLRLAIYSSTVDRGRGVVYDIDGLLDSGLAIMSAHLAPLYIVEAFLWVMRASSQANEVDC